MMHETHITVIKLTLNDKNVSLSILVFLSLFKNLLTCPSLNKTKEGAGSPTRLCTKSLKIH